MNRGSRRFTQFFPIWMWGGLRESLSEALPGDQIAVEAQGGKVFLTGVVGSDAEAETAGKLAAVYSKEVLNSLVVDPQTSSPGPRKVRFAELDRSKLTQWGVNLLSTGNNTGASTTGQFSPPGFPQVGGGKAAALINDVLNLFYFNVPNGIGLTIKDLQNERNSGNPGGAELDDHRWRASKVPRRGRVPISRDPARQRRRHGDGHNSVQTLWSQAGVYALCIRGRSIRLKVAPEVSALDYSNVVVIAGYTLPSLSTRKAETEIELRDRTDVWYLRYSSTTARPTT